VPGQALEALGDVEARANHRVFIAKCLQLRFACDGGRPASSGAAGFCGTSFVSLSDLP